MIGQKGRSYIVYVTLEDSDLVVHHYKTKPGLLLELVFDGDQEYWYVLWSKPDSDVEKDRLRCIGWKGTFDDTKKFYKNMTIDMIIDDSGFTDLDLPHNEDASWDLVQKLKKAKKEEDQEAIGHVFEGEDLTECELCGSNLQAPWHVTQDEVERQYAAGRR